MDKPVNFRDLGGLGTACGKKLRKNRLLRCGQVSGLGAEDVIRLQKHGLHQIVDLRRPWETEVAPNDRIEWVNCVNIDIMAGRASMDRMASAEGWIKDLNPTHMDGEMMEIYRYFAASPHAKKGYAEFLRLCLENEKGAILFHCAHGKDRTGFAAAVILRILGVADEDIYKDYMLTNKMRKAANAEAMERYRTQGMNEEQIAAMEILYNVRREYLAAAFDAVNEKYGCFENYVEQGLGLTLNDVARLKELYLE